LGGETRNAIRKELSTPEEAAVIIQASRLEAWKGQRLLLEALSQLRQVAGWICWIAGGAQRPSEATYLEELKSMTVASGIADRVRFLGQRSDVSELLGSADIHCQPNTQPEPFGVAFIEALYAGLPVVTTSMGAAVEIVDPQCGVLVPADSAALADALNRLIGSRASRERLGAAGPATAAALCDPGRQFARLHQALAALRETALRETNGQRDGIAV
jgi:glycosyltransferase involved in cell wall biosynthesis